MTTTQMAAIETDSASVEPVEQNVQQARQLDEEALAWVGGGNTSMGNMF